MFHKPSTSINYKVLYYIHIFCGSSGSSGMSPVTVVDWQPPRCSCHLAYIPHSPLQYTHCHITHSWSSSKVTICVAVCIKCHCSVYSFNNPLIHLCHKHYIYPLAPSPALPLTGSAHRTVHGELGFNSWKKIWVYPSVNGKW